MALKLYFWLMINQKNEGDEKKILVRNLLVIGDGLKGVDQTHRNV